MGFLRAGPPSPGAELPPAAQRRRHRHQGPALRPPARASTAAPDDHPGLRRRVPRHHDELVQRTASPAPRSPSSTAPARPGTGWSSRRRASCSASSAPAGDRRRSAPTLAGQRPSKIGFSFAMKASTAARWSSVPPVRAIFSASKASDSAKECDEECSTDRRIEPKATVGPAASRTASSRDRGRELVGGHDVGGQPELEGLGGRDRAREVEQLHGPAPAHEARQRPARPGVARERDPGEGRVEGGRVRQHPEVAAKARLAPAPAATPLTAATTGLAIVARASTIGL